MLTLPFLVPGILPGKTQCSHTQVAPLPAWEDSVQPHAGGSPLGNTVFLSSGIILAGRLPMSKHPAAFCVPRD